jgi:hypothetical protein
MPSSLTYIPMFWGQSNLDAWNARKVELQTYTPPAILAFNEPDVTGTANSMTPDAAASLFMQEIWPYSGRGIQMGSPGIAFDLDWMQSFLGSVAGRGGRVDFVALHWYVHNFLNPCRTEIFFIGMDHGMHYPASSPTSKPPTIVSERTSGSLNLVSQPLRILPKTK